MQISKGLIIFTVLALVFLVLHFVPIKQTQTCNPSIPGSTSTVDYRLIFGDYSKFQTATKVPAICSGAVMMDTSYIKLYIF